MNPKEKIKEYVLKNYKKTFIKKIITRDGKGQKVKTSYIDLKPLITIKENHIEVQNHKDASPLILSKNILE